MDKNLQKKAAHCSEQENNAVKAERDSIKFMQIKFMQNEVGNTFNGIISGVSDWGLYVELDANKCEGMVHVKDIEDVKVLYKFKEESSEINFDDIEWKFFNTDGKSDIDLTASAENEISGLFEKQGSYQEIPFSVTNLPEFTSFAVKVVMNSDNPSYVPKLQDIRAVASF